MGPQRTPRLQESVKDTDICHALKASDLAVGTVPEQVQGDEGVPGMQPTPAHELEQPSGRDIDQPQGGIHGTADCTGGRNKTASGSGSATSQATQKAMQLLYDPDAVFKDMLVNGEFSTDEAALY